ncbi:MAG TPA: hypothetical protein VEO01_30680 [Pseudonocardiaceae bacterium]|nr:hypothetical protein [Pseudonocardiaceae bacterium]
MDSLDRTVRQWAALPREVLTTTVAAAVRQPPQQPSRFWRAVSDDVVLAAAIRGILAGMRRDKQGSRDESFWAYRIATVRALLDSTEPASADVDEPPTTSMPVAFSATSQAPVAGPPGESVPDGPTTLSVPSIEFLAP